MHLYCDNRLDSRIHDHGFDPPLKRPTVQPALHDPYIGASDSARQASKARRSRRIRLGMESPSTEARRIAISESGDEHTSVEVFESACQKVFVGSRAVVEISAASATVSHPAISRIQDIVAADFGLTRHDLVSARRSDDVVLPRHIAMHLAMVMTMNSLAEVCRRFGNRDHSTVIKGINKIKARLATDSALAERTQFLKARIATGAFK